MSGRTPWAVVKVRARLRRGWEAWVAPGGVTLWARMVDDGHRMETTDVGLDEMAVLDEVLREKVR